MEKSVKLYLVCSDARPNIAVGGNVNAANVNAANVNAANGGNDDAAAQNHITHHQVSEKKITKFFFYCLMLLCADIGENQRIISLNKNTKNSAETSATKNVEAFHKLCDTLKGALGKVVDSNDNLAGGVAGHGTDYISHG